MKPICQLDLRDPDLRGHGCTLASLAWLARWATDGEAVPKGAEERYVARLLDLSGVSLADFRDRGTKLDEAETAYEALTFEGRVRPQMRRMRGGSVRDDLLPALRSGSWAVVAVDYGEVQDAGKGVGSFRGGHAVVVGDPRDGSVAVMDPLRREAVRWPVALLERAMETFGRDPWGGGRGEAGIVERAMTILELRTQQRDQALADLAAERTTCQRTIAARDVTIANLKTDKGALERDLKDEQAAHGITREALATVEGDRATIAESLRIAQEAERSFRDQLDAAEKRIAELEARPVPDCSGAETDRAAALVRAEAAEAVIAALAAADRALHELAARITA